MRLAKLLENQILSKVRILILIHHYISETSGNRLQRSRIIPEQYIHIQEDIIKIHHSCLLAFLNIELINIAYPRLLCRGIILQDCRIPAISLRSHKIILGHRYSRKHILRLIYLVIKLKFLQTSLDSTDRVASIINRECRRIAQ